MTTITYFQAIVIAILQGVSELFPISSLGHSILVPALLGGSWTALVHQSTESTKVSPYLAYLVALHVATALALIWFYRRDWARIIVGFFRTLKYRKIETVDERLAWLLIIGTIPVGIVGLALQHKLSKLFTNPLAAAIFLTINGVVLLTAEYLVRRAKAKKSYTRRQLDSLGYGEAGVIGFFQIFALLAGISRSGITLVGGLLRGLNHEDALRFAFLLATPVIFAAGVLELPSLAGAAGKGLHGQVIVGMIVAGLTAYASIRFLTRYFQTRTLTPFAIYCLIAGGLCILRFA
jgi:undecaprenyl-diphosphatase